MDPGVNYNIRLYPLCSKTKDLVKNGAIGAVYFITGSLWLLH
ncbi:MAG: hypothetical protein M2R45_04213 [Verrucomicrobia subdivision 3 bacterium]|nr:hypothetical protein [Limisphaerales bacterium]MCS1417050.1 hypothetical protein [Limisphaerales bacterium]